MTLSPSATELVVAVGGPELVVGYDEYSAKLDLDIEPEPKVVGDFLSPSFEAIARLEPELVVADALQEKVVRGLEAAGIPTLALPMHTIDDVWKAATAVGAAIGREGSAATLRAKGAEAMTAARSRARGRDPVRVLVVLDRSPDSLAGMVAAGPGSYAGELLKVVGATNVLESSKVRYPRIAAEQIRRGRPDVVIDASPRSADHLQAWQRLAGVPAVSAGRVIATDDRRITAPSVQVTSVIPELERMVYGSSSDESAGHQDD